MAMNSGSHSDAQDTYFLADGSESAYYLNERSDYIGALGLYCKYERIFLYITSRFSIVADYGFDSFYIINTCD